MREIRVGAAPLGQSPRHPLLLLAVLVLFLPSPPRGADSFFLKITLNGEDKGEHLVHLQDDGDFLVRTADLAAMGLSLPKGRRRRSTGSRTGR